MPTHNPERQRLVSRTASLKRWHPDDPDIPQLRTELVTMRLVETITKAVAAAPRPLDAGQRARIVEAVYSELNGAAADPAA